MVVLVAEATLVSKDGSGEVEANWLSVLLGHGLCFIFVTVNDDTEREMMR